MINNDLFSRWYPLYYDRRDTQTYDIELFEELLEGRQKVFEICCGTGRILLPLAKRGHEMHGIDMDENMLARLMEKAEGIENIHLIKGNAETCEWGQGYDAVIMAGNIVMNIDGSDDPIRTQKAFVKKSYDALKDGGLFIMDNDCWKHPEDFFKNRSEPVVKDLGTGQNGVSAKIIYVWSTYDSGTQMCVNFNRRELTAPDGEKRITEKKYVNHIPTRAQMTGWAKDAGLTILNEWGDYYRNPVTDETHRLVILARKE